MSELKALIRNRVKCCAKSGANGESKLWQSVLDRIEELETPDMFWDVDNSEDNVNDPRDSFENGFSQYTKVGETITFESATRLPNITYQLTELNEDGSFEIEPVTQK